MRKLRNDQSAFTIVELILALAIFGFVMVIITTGFTQIMRSYRQSLVSQRTQEAGRELINQLLKQAHTAKTLTITDAAGGDPIQYLCLGDIQYQYNADQNTLEQGSNTAGGACNSPTTTSPVIDQEGLQVSRFDIEAVESPSDKLLGFNVDLILATSENSLLKPGAEACNPAVSGAHFCATTRITTSIGVRTLEN